MQMRRLFIAVLCCAVLVACGSTGSETRTEVTKESTPETVPVSKSEAALASECEVAKSTQPTKVAYDAFDSFGTITTSLSIQKNGTILIAGLMSDVHDFDSSSAVNSFGVEGYSFEFIAAFNSQAEFQWIRCLRQESIYHWYRGVTIDSDNKGDIYVCGEKLLKFSRLGTLLWTRGDVEDEIKTCATDSRGNTIVSGMDTMMFNSIGKKLWTLKNTAYSTIAPTLDDGAYVANPTELSRTTPDGKILWSLKFERHNDRGSNGVFVGAGDEFPSDQVGLESDSKGNVFIALPINKTNDLDPSSAKKVLTPNWIQDLVIAKYSRTGELLWANKLRITGAKEKTTMRFADGFDISYLPNGDLLVLGGGKIQSYDNESRLFMARFSNEGDQKSFLWLDEYHSFIHNVGHELSTDESGRTFVTAERQGQAPFLSLYDLQSN
jgi:hypothetical protein